VDGDGFRPRVFPVLARRDGLHSVAINEATRVMTVTLRVSSSNANLDRMENQIAYHLQHQVLTASHERNQRHRPL
jgi:hypothetical protein